MCQGTYKESVCKYTSFQIHFATCLSYAGWTLRVKNIGIDSIAQAYRIYFNLEFKENHMKFINRTYFLREELAELCQIIVLILE